MAVPVSAFAQYKVWLYRAIASDVTHIKALKQEIFSRLARKVKTSF